MVIDGRDMRTCWEVSHPFGVARQMVTWWPRRVQSLIPSTVLFLKNSRAFAKVSIRMRVVGGWRTVVKEISKQVGIYALQRHLGRQQRDLKSWSDIGCASVGYKSVEMVSRLESGGLPGGSSLTFIESGCKLHERVGWLECVIPCMLDRFTGA